MKKQTNLYFMCPDVEEPIGGVKVLYRHVDVLNRNGFSASIMHKKKGFRSTWFDNKTRVVYIPDVKINKFDYLIIPEFYGYGIADIEKGIKKIIFNQGAYLTFIHYPIDAHNTKTPYVHKEIIAAIVVSEDSRKYLKYVFPRLKIFRTRNGINPSLFNYCARKKRQIAFMPKKLFEDTVQIANILRLKGLLKNFRLVPIQNKNEYEVAGILKESLIFLSFSCQEGCPLPPMEAMACGCTVIGYTGRGGKEYFKPEFSFPVEDGDIIGFAKTVEKVIKQYEKNKTPLLKKGLEASTYILKRYSLEREEHSIVNTWENILNKTNMHLRSRK